MKEAPVEQEQDFEVQEAPEEVPAQEVKPKTDRDLSYWKSRARKAEELVFEREFPGVDPKTFKGMSIDQALALKAVLGAPAAQAQEPEAPAHQEPPEAQALAQAAELSGPSAAPLKTFTFAEAKKMGGYSNPEVRELIRQGRVEGIT